LETYKFGIFLLEAAKYLDTRECMWLPETHKCGLCQLETAKYLENRECMWLCQLEAALYLETYKSGLFHWRLPFIWKPISVVSASWRLSNT
jgi:hypothetical protein